MRNPARIEIVLSRIGEIWSKHPDLRLGQIIENVRRAHLNERDLFYIEDYDLLRAIEDIFGNGEHVEVPTLFGGK